MLMSFTHDVSKSEKKKKMEKKNGNKEGKFQKKVKKKSLKKFNKITGWGIHPMVLCSLLIHFVQLSSGNLKHKIKN